jgi:acetoin utilization deacetylase AcuC-like enzyme
VAQAEAGQVAQPASNPRVAFISHADCGRHDTGWNHPEHVGRLRAVTRALRNYPDLFQTVDHVEGRHATADELSLAHDRGYIESIEKLSDAGGAQLDLDTTVSSGSWAAATAGAGCVLDAVDRAIAGTNLRSFCAVRPPGHHALRDRGMGFCLFGNVAVAAHYARQKYSAAKILIVDWDVHHGNGTQALVENEPDIRFVSMHQWPWYPGTGAAEDRGPHRTVWNLPMPTGLSPRDYVDALQRGIDSATQGFVPDFIFISAGFDSLSGDPLGGFTLEIEHFEDLTRSLVKRAESWCGGKLVSALEGGYAPDRVGAACVAHLDALA